MCLHRPVRLVPPVRPAAVLLALVLTTGCGAGGDPGFDVVVDPYSISPLTAVVNVRGLNAAEVESVDVVVRGQGGSPDLERTYQPGAPGYDPRWGTPEVAFPADGFHVPVVGLYADRVNQVRIAVHALDGRIFVVAPEIETHLASPGDVLGRWIPDIHVSTSAPERMEPGWTLVELDLGDVGRQWARPLAFDERGAIRWALRLDFLGDYALPMFRSSTGNFLTGRFGELLEISELGRIVRTLPLPGFSAHHELQEIAEGPRRGDLLVAVDQLGVPTVGDRVVELDRSSGGIVQVWDLGQVLDPSRTALVDLPLDWFHNNGLAYSAADDCLVVSGRYQGVAKIDRAGRLRWVLAPHRGWRSPQAERLLTAISTSGTPYDDGVQDGGEVAPGFDWAWGQHNPTLLPDGDLLLFDNGWSRRFDPSAPPYSRAVRYRVDEAAMTVRQVWEYGADRGSAYYSLIVGSAELLPATGNVLVQPGVTQLHQPGSAAVVTEVNAGGEVVFDATVHFANPVAARGASSFDFSYRAHRYVF